MKKRKGILTGRKDVFPDILNYQIGEKSIAFECTGVDEDGRFKENNSGVGELFNAFLLELSEGKKVFFYGYRMERRCTGSEEARLIAPGEILARAKAFGNRDYRQFFALKSAKVNSLDFHLACEADIYYFENSVEWADFLVSTPIRKPEKLLEEGLLSAVFSYSEFGGDFYFLGSKAHESRILRLFEELSGRGYQIKSGILKNSMYKPI